MHEYILQTTLMVMLENSTYRPTCFGLSWSIQELSIRDLELQQVKQFMTVNASLKDAFLLIPSTRFQISHLSPQIHSVPDLLDAILCNMDNRHLSRPPIRVRHHHKSRAARAGTYSSVKVRSLREELRNSALRPSAW